VFWVISVYFNIRNTRSLAHSSWDTLYIYTYVHVCIHTYIPPRMHACIHTHTYIHIYEVKMADDVSQRIEDALNLIVNITDKSWNMKKELKKSVHEAVA